MAQQSHFLFVIFFAKFLDIQNSRMPTGNVGRIKKIINENMINITDSNIREFQALYKEHFGIEISKEDATEQGMKLVRLILLVCEKPCEEETTSKLKTNLKK